MTNAPNLDRRGILWYLILTFVLTWSLDFALMAAGARFDQMQPWALLAVTLSMFFPAIAAFVVRRWITREGMASAGLRVGPWRHYLWTWLLVPLLFGLIYLLSWLLGVAQLDLGLTAAIAQLQSQAAAQGVPAPPAGVLLASTLVASLTLGPVITSLATFGEEFGWTGYLLPKLLPLGKWRATLLYGLIWGLWHAPIIFGGYNYPGYPILGILMMCLFTITIGLWQTALRLRSGSVLLTTWFHALINTQGRGIWALLFVGVQPILGGPLGLAGLLLFALGGLWLLWQAPEDTHP